MPISTFARSVANCPGPVGRIMARDVVHCAAVIICGAASNYAFAMKLLQWPVFLNAAGPGALVNSRTFCTNQHVSQRDLNRHVVALCDCAESLI